MEGASLFVAERSKNGFTRYDREVKFIPPPINNNLIVFVMNLRMIKYKLNKGKVSSQNKREARKKIHGGLV